MLGKIYLFISLMFLLSIYNFDKQFYIKNIVNENSCSKIIVNSFDYNFRMLIELIMVCVLNYFYLFKICYLQSVNIIFYCVTNYFLVFNILFEYVLKFIELCILNSYYYSLHIIFLVGTYPNNYLIFCYFMTKLYLNFRQ